MLNWIVIAGCVGGIAGFLFGVIVERARRHLFALRAQHVAERERATHLAIQVDAQAIDRALANGGYTNGSAHASLDA